MTEAELKAAALGVIAARYSQPPTDPDYILPADIPLELSGEAVRARLCLFTDDRGHEMSMRPDLTLPIALGEVERRLGGNNHLQTYTYAARAFRLPATPDDPLEFTQVGFEEFGADRWGADDVRPFYNVMLALEACGVRPSFVVTGDLAILPAVADALGLPEAVSGLIKRAYRQEGGVSALLASPPAPLAPEVAAILEAAEPEAALQAHMAERNMLMIGARSTGEILEGLKARAAAVAAGGIPAEASQVLEAIGHVRCPLGEAADKIAAFARTQGLGGLDEPVERLAKRAALMIERGIAGPGKAIFRSGFGRRFTYYDGFVFEILTEGLSPAQAVAAGGRYDGLLSSLSGGRVSANGIGGALRVDRLVRARRAAA